VRKKRFKRQHKAVLYIGKVEIIDAWYVQFKDKTDALLLQCIESVVAPAVQVPLHA
jgi:hypothetical protein